jgi:hypothetical protein
LAAREIGQTRRELRDPSGWDLTLGDLELF